MELVVCALEINMQFNFLKGTSQVDALASTLDLLSGGVSESAANDYK